MNGPAALRYVLRRLALEGLNDPEQDDAELYDYIGEGRDYVLIELALTFYPGTYSRSNLTLDSAADPPTYSFAAAELPIRVIELYEIDTFSPLTPMVTHDDLGEYRWVTRQKLETQTGLTPAGGIAAVWVPEGVDIDEDTDDLDAAWGIPTFAHRAACKYAAYLSLTANEETDGKNAEKQFERDMDRVLRIASEFDAAGGLAARFAFLQGQGQRDADTLY